MGEKFKYPSKVSFLFPFFQIAIKFEGNHFEWTISCIVLIGRFWNNFIYLWRTIQLIYEKKKKPIRMYATRIYVYTYIRIVLIALSWINFIYLWRTIQWLIAYVYRLHLDYTSQQINKKYFTICQLKWFVILYSTNTRRKMYNTAWKTYDFFFRMLFFFSPPEYFSFQTFFH